ncbi:PD-(D/E)XK nuclease family protein [Staphylococcus simulans]|uniref:PDDEXK-like family protein n=1 Tax=Staphylococcus simulans TaxID=1286 RepID=UPI000D032AC2|nr:PD-(D/E)XK nuclease family protein [Staphylococcus simulans]
MNRDETALLAFLKDIDCLKEVEKHSNQFNLFEVLGVVDTEIRHSNMLAWLLDPNEIHGLNDTFLKEVIKLYIDGTERFSSNQTLFKLLLNDFEDAVVLREWRNIDILVVSEQNQTVIVIENKIWSKESKHQLKKYQSIVDREYPGYEQLFLFLTPEGDDASDSATWSSVAYSQILDCIRAILESKANIINPKVVDFINQYIGILRRHIVGDETLEEICSQIYAKHKRALDLIFEYKPDILNDISKMLQEHIAQNDELVLDQCSKSYVRFTTKSLDRVMPLNKTENKWTPSNRVVLYEIVNTQKLTGIYLLIGPAETEERTLVFEAAKRCEHLKTRKLSKEYTRIYSKNFYRRNDRSEMSHEEILEKVLQAFDKFIQSDMKTVEEELLAHYSRHA